MAFRELIAVFIAAEAKPREKFGHQPRLYALTKGVGEGFEYDDDVAAEFFRQVNLGLVHQRSFEITDIDLGAVFCTA